MRAILDFLPALDANRRLTCPNVCVAAPSFMPTGLSLNPLMVVAERLAHGRVENAGIARWGGLWLNGAPHRLVDGG